MLKAGTKVIHADGSKGVVLGLAERASNWGDGTLTIPGYYCVSFFKGTMILQPIHESMLTREEDQR